MSTLTPVTVRTPQQPRTIPDVSIMHNGHGDVGEQFNEAVRYGAATLGFKQPETTLTQRQPAIQPISGVVVAPGIMVSAAEYQERYGGIDLEGLRQRMNPAVYKAFVRFIGSIPGREDLDVTIISDIPED